MTNSTLKDLGNNMCTLSEEFGLTQDFLFEVIKKGYTQKRFLNKVEKFLNELHSDLSHKVTEEDIDEWIEDCIWEANEFYNSGQITKEQRDRYIAMDSDRENVRKMLEQEEKPLYELIATAEFISAILDKPTKSFNYFLKLNNFDKRLEKNFQKLKDTYDKDKLVEIIPTLLSDIVEEIKKDDVIYALGIYDQKDITSWKESVAELEESLKSFV